MRSWLRVVLALASSCVLAASSGCSAKIGDACASSTDCSVNGDRLCDTTEPGGYCTIFNCEPDSCPDESVCVAFDVHADPRCSQDDRWSRFERTYCMFRCESDSDCRAGYACIDTTDVADSIDARVVDLSPAGYKICVVPSSGAPQTGATDVCGSYDGGFPDVNTSTGSDAAADASDAAADAPDAAADASDASSDVSDASQDIVVVDSTPDGFSEAAPADALDDVESDVLDAASD